MSRDSDEVNKLTESTYKVRETTLTSKREYYSPVETTVARASVDIHP